MAIDGYEAGRDRKWQLGPDIIEECKAVTELPAVDQEQWKPVFEPTDFNDAHGPLLI